MDWGLGHATRCIPIINLLLKKRQRVILAGSGLSLSYLKIEFPQLETVSLPGVDIQFETGQGFGFKTFLLGWKLKKYVSEELAITKKIVREFKVDVIISDNRYGVRCEGVRNILITHQLYPRVPGILRPFVHSMIRTQVGEFDQCWIPDNQSENESESGNENVDWREEVQPILSGELSHQENLPENTHFIGPLSRFVRSDEATDKDIDILAILSGPEPARSDFEETLRKILPALPGRKVLICGKEIGPEDVQGSLQIIAGATSEELKMYILRSKKIICRSGYSTLMDLVALNRSALVVPTPGQSEQEYLAQYLSQKDWFFALSQDKLETQLMSALEKITDDISFAAPSLQKVVWLLNLDDAK
jgi:UDP:flavonoid glycosyltransferase YjiC (YdhE family)